MEPPIWKCPSCGLGHLRIEVRLLAHPMESRTGVLFTHWYPCPVTGDPVYTKEQP
jgi:hypothetical protein